MHVRTNFRDPRVGPSPTATVNSVSCWLLWRPRSSIHQLL